MKNWKALSAKELQEIKTLGQLKALGYSPRSVKEELRENLIALLQRGENPFPGIHGYEDSVLPDVQRAILSGHNINLLGLRGQAKTRIARQMVQLLDPLVPVLEGSALQDDPMQPLSRFGRDLIAEHGDNAPIAWLPREARYTEKLATPDVTVADLIGDIDPIKAANLKLDYSDERVLHFGLVPRAHRGIFVINELPDLQPRIQVALFNILQEGDIQIRGFKLRLPLDIQFVFTANPEDYTNRGSIVTPLKDRIGSQILTHYPEDIATARTITRQEARIRPELRERISISLLAEDLVEQVAFEARESEYIDEKSGVSARLTISAMENLYSAAERRMLLNNEAETHIRISDFNALLPAIAGKVELVYEGEQEGANIVAQSLIQKAIRTQFPHYFPDPQQVKKQKNNPYDTIVHWFNDNELDLLLDATADGYAAALRSVEGLEAFVHQQYPKVGETERFFLMEFLLHGLAEFSMLSKKQLKRSTSFGDLLSGMFSMPDGFEDEE